MAFYKPSTARSDAFLSSALSFENAFSIGLTSGLQKDAVEVCLSSLICQGNHQRACSDEGACTNNTERFFSTLRRAKIGTHHRIAGPYLNTYAGEMA